MGILAKLRTACGALLDILNTLTRAGSIGAGSDSGIRHQQEVVLDMFCISSRYFFDAKSDIAVLPERVSEITTFDSMPLFLALIIM